MTKVTGPAWVSSSPRLLAAHPLQSLLVAAADRMSAGRLPFELSSRLTVRNNSEQAASGWGHRISASGQPLGRILDEGMPG